jgi:DNA-binding response OmpR family regulator
VATILILDNDLGFSFWLGQSLTAPHCRALPAKSVAEAVALIGQFKLKIDFLIMNPAVPGANDFTRALRREQRHLRVAALVPETGESGERFESLQTVTEREN